MTDTPPPEPQSTLRPRRRIARAVRIVLMCIGCGLLCVIAYWLGNYGGFPAFRFRATMRAAELEREGRIDEAIDWCNRALSRVIY